MLVHIKEDTGTEEPKNRGQRDGHDRPAGTEEPSLCPNQRNRPHGVKLGPLSPYLSASPERGGGPRSGGEVPSRRGKTPQSSGFRETPADSSPFRGAEGNERSKQNANNADQAAAGGSAGSGPAARAAAAGGGGYGRIRQKDRSLVFQRTIPLFFGEPTAFMCLWESPGYAGEATGLCGHK